MKIGNVLSHYFPRPLSQSGGERVHNQAQQPANKHSAFRLALDASLAPIHMQDGSRTVYNESELASVLTEAEKKFISELETSG